MGTENGAGYAGQMGVSDDTSEYNKVAFVARQLVNLIATAKVVRVLAVTNAGGVEPVGFVDVQPLVNQVDGLGNPTPHGTVHNLPYARAQGGTDAIILDPKVGDIGIAVFADRDSSSVKAQRGGPANPGSRRKYDMADGVYLFGILNGVPVNYIQFVDGGINVVSPNKVEINCKDAVVHASHSASTDVFGYGSRTTYEGGSNFLITNYVLGANVTEVNVAWSPPAIPPP